MSASDSSPTFRRLFVLDRRTDAQFLVDTGADLCVVPRKFVAVHGPKTDYELSAANGTLIATYGTATLTLKPRSASRLYLAIHSGGCLQANHRSRFSGALWPSGGHW